MSTSSEILNEAVFPSRKPLDLLSVKCNSEVIKAKSSLTTPEVILGDLQFVTKFNSSEIKDIMSIHLKDDLQLNQGNEFKKNRQLFHCEQTSLCDGIILNESPLKNFNGSQVASKISSVKVDGNVMIEPCEDSSTSVMVIENIYCNYSDYFSDDESQQHIRSNKIASSSECKIVFSEETIPGSKGFEYLEDVPDVKCSEATILGAATNLNVSMKIETQTVDAENHSKTRKWGKESPDWEGGLVDNSNKKIKISYQINNSGSECQRNCSYTGDGLDESLRPTSNNSSADSSILSNITSNKSAFLLTSAEENEKISSCVKNWNKKYHWMTYVDGTFKCTICPESTPIFKLEKVSQIYYVSSYLLEHESANCHKLAMNSLNNRLIIFTLEFIQTSALAFNSKAFLYQSLINKIEVSFKIKVTEKQIDDLIKQTNLMVQQLQMDKIRKAASGEISVIVDECRYILFVKSINSAGHPEEYFVSRYLADQSSFDHLLRTLFQKIVYFKIVFCGHCQICLAKGRTFTHDTLPIRYPKLSDFLIGLEKDNVINPYRVFLEQAPTQHPLIFTKKYHWADKMALVLLKSKIPEMFKQFSYMKEIFQIFDIFKRAILEQKMLPKYSLKINHFLDKLKGVLSNATVHYIALFVMELNQRSYYYGLQNILQFNFLFSPLKLQKLSQSIHYSKGFGEIFYTLRSKFPETTREKMMLCLVEFGKYICQKMSFKLSLFEILQKFNEDKSLRERFSLVHKFYKIIAVLPFFSASIEYSFFRVSASCFTVNNLFGPHFASQISSILMVDRSAVQQYYEENNGVSLV